MSVSGYLLGQVKHASPNQSTAAGRFFWDDLSTVALPSVDNLGAFEDKLMESNGYCEPEMGKLLKSVDELYRMQASEYHGRGSGSPQKSPGITEKI